ncbi:cytochrome b N-terminal domain-containing protein [Phycisphaerales bacterium AB-hyl4]|uniref:Cytochrome b N-terminal domain-containing protein n=1 Tax=Natronomicrosphaera hydrolytica TaxID=3242702 RepID=A0ABV4U3G8_9BACT
MFKQWGNWLSHRFGFDVVKRNVLDRRTPKGRWYYGDGATLTLLLGVQVATGAVLMLTYNPSVDSAYQSVRYITEQQLLGRFIRSLHYWSAGLMVVMLFFHLFRQLLLGGYKSPREGTWLLGVGLFVGVLVMAFTGYTLRWDERAIHSIMVPMHMVANVPLIGESLVVFIQGGPEVGPRTLTRLYAVHVFWTPLYLFTLVAGHLFLVIHHGVTTNAERREPVTSAEHQRKLYDAEKHDEREGEQFHPGTTFRSGLFATVVFLIVLGLAVFVGPPSLYPEANRELRSFPVEEWWFWWYSALIALLPGWLAPTFVVVFPLLLLAALVALPFVDRSPYRGIKRRPVMACVVVFSVIALVWLSALRVYSPWTGWPQPEPPAVPMGVTLPADAERGRQLFGQYGCNSCHAVAGDGPRIGPDLARIGRTYSRAEFANWILNPAEDVAMPSYEGRLDDEELEQIIDYLMNARTFPRR